MDGLEKNIFLRVLKGAPMSVLFGLWIHGSMNRKKLKVKTGWGYEAIDNALIFLEELGLVTRVNYRQWSVSDGFFNLPLPFPETPRIGVSDGYPQVVNGNVLESSPQAESPKTRVSESESVRIGVSALSSSSGSRSTTKNEVSPLLPCPGILEVCTEVGIFGKKRTLLATLSHVVEAGPDFVRGHVKSAPSIELAIYRLEHNWNLPKSRNGLKQQIPEEYKNVISH